MRRRRVILLPTLVLVVCVLKGVNARGAIDSPSPDFEETTKTRPVIKKDEERAADTLNISPPPPEREETKNSQEYFYPYRHALTFRAGMAFSSVTTNNTNTPIVGGMNFLFINPELKSYEAGADLFSDGTGMLHFARRWIFTRSRLRPYFKGGGGLLVKPADGFAIFVNYRNFKAEGAAGAELLVRNSQSVRAEIEASVGLNGIHALGSLGYVWAW